MDSILETRLYWSFGIAIFGMFIIPAIFGFFMIRKYLGKKAPWWMLPICCLYLYLFFTHARDLIPEKYDVKTIQVYKCEYVDKVVPKYN